jgi:hypothetical protein
MNFELFDMYAIDHAGRDLTRHFGIIASGLTRIFTTLFGFKSRPVGH